MAVWGLDVQEVRLLSTQLNQKAADISSILTTLTTTLNNTHWEGPDATRFRSAWTGTHTAALKKVIADLTTAANNAQRNALEQDITSR